MCGWGLYNFYYCRVLLADLKIVKNGRLDQEEINIVLALEKDINTYLKENLLFRQWYYNMLGKFHFHALSDYNQSIKYLNKALGFKIALEKIDTITKKLNKPLGFHIVESDHNKVLEKINKGYSFLAFSLDFFFLGDKARSEMDMLKKKL